MTRDVNDAVRMPVQHRDDVVGGEIVTDGALDFEAAFRERLDRSPGLFFRGGQIVGIRVFRLAALAERCAEARGGRIADHIGMPAAGLSNALPELSRRQLPDHARADRERLFVRQHELPREDPRGFVDDQHDRLQVPRGFLELVRHEKLEQRAAEIGIVVRVVAAAWPSTLR